MEEIEFKNVISAAELVRLGWRPHGWLLPRRIASSPLSTPSTPVTSARSVHAHPADDVAFPVLDEDTALVRQGPGISIGVSHGYVCYPRVPGCLVGPSVAQRTPAGNSPQNAMRATTFMTCLKGRASSRERDGWEP